MPREFHDHPRKQTVRLRWDTPILEWFYRQWGRKYFYLGLPGQQALDVKLWKEMIERIIAFEIEVKNETNRRIHVIELARELTLLGINQAVYCGPMEEVLLRREDHDRKPLIIDEFVTLFNLDFCNSISSYVYTEAGHRQLRFEALREIVAFQRTLFRRTGVSRFILLITARNSFHNSVVREFFSNRDLPPTIRDFYRSSLRLRPLSRADIEIDYTDVLKTFVYSFLQSCFHGQNITSLFLPPLTYRGSSTKSPMIHFVVICKMNNENSVSPTTAQSAADYLRLKTVRATNTRIVEDWRIHRGEQLICDPVDFVRQFSFFQEG